MASENGMTDLTCPICQRPLNDSEREWISKLLSETQPGDVDYFTPDAWQILSCGHRAEAVVDRTNPDAPTVRLRPAG